MTSDIGVATQTVTGLEARFTWRVDYLLRYLKSFFEVISQVRQKVVALSLDVIHANSIRSGLVATAATFRLGTTVAWHLHEPAATSSAQYLNQSLRVSLRTHANDRRFRKRLPIIFGAPSFLCESESA